jgi:chloride channel 3/4/5
MESTMRLCSLSRTLDLGAYAIALLRTTLTVSTRLSFKLKPPNPSTFSFPRLFAPSQPSRKSHSRSPAPNRSHNAPYESRNNEAANSSTEAILPYLNAPADPGTLLQDTKDPAGLDWYVEGPGRRVGYDDLTAIDWIFEYAKERQRQRVLYSSSSGITGYILQIADASQIWVILIITGIAAGTLAAFIDIASDWLGDLKEGVCGNVQEGGKFYLSKPFCCWGHDGKH